ncbi:MAG: hypothetical protein QOF01_214 [Thermomicrobiales bacterium]|jgi:hypothetical protein|nr:hypothetical protein [Thermomicrobiales bacterium]MEA2593745.1 hypothetical protein [Thermomicrobiales bacterium]
MRHGASITPPGKPGQGPGAQGVGLRQLSKEDEALPATEEVWSYLAASRLVFTRWLDDPSQTPS